MNNTIELVNRVAESIREGAMLGVMAQNAMHGYIEDDISEIQAFKRYGKAWIKDRTERGQLHFSRVGGAKKSTKNYSIFEIETLKRAEKEVELMYNLVVNNA
jgi:hypothetical protein